MCFDPPRGFWRVSIQLSKGIAIVALSLCDLELLNGSSASLIFGLTQEWNQRYIVDDRYIDHREIMPKRKLDPLPSAAFQILLALAGEDMHGYGIMRQVEEQTSGRMRLGPGTLYSSIQALVEEKLIEEVSRDGSGPNEERRRYYHLTSAGRKLARSEAERMAGTLRVARARKILRGDYV